MNLNIKKYILHIPRILLGLVFALSGIGKLIDSEDAKYLVELMATKFFWLIEWRDELVMGLTIIELALAVMLLWGKQLFKTYIASFIFVSGFTAVIGYFLLQGFSVESCGCFGAFGFSGGLEATLIRNVVLLILAATGTVLLVRRKPSVEEQD